MEMKSLLPDKEIHMLDKMGNICRTDSDNPDQSNTIKAQEEQIDNSTMNLPTDDNDTKLHVTNKTTNNESLVLEVKDCDDNESLKHETIIITEYLSGNYQKFFEVWDNTFPSSIKESIEYKIMTLKLRVHYAILPIRIVQLRQHIDCKLSCSSKIIRIFSNVADKYTVIDNEKDSEEENNKFYVDSMKQLEEFLNSCDGRKLTEELKDSPLITFFALPYLDKPQEDESVKKIFTIDWLEELTTDLEKFVNQLPKHEDLESKSCTTHRSDSSVIETVLTVTDRKSKLTETEGELICCNRIIHSAIKNKEIEDWISNFHPVDPTNNLSTKSTQTRISSLKTGIGFSMISEPHHIASLVTPSVFAIPSKQSVLYNDELSTTKTRLFSVHKHYRKLKLRFHKLHEDYQKMNDIAEVLTIALESSVQGKPVSLDMILQSCSKILPDRFHKMDIQTDSEDTSTEIKELPEQMKNSKRNERNSTLASLEMLNYEKVKLHLRNGDIKTKLLLLVALRQKLTSAEAENRDSIVRSYVNNDILSLKYNNTSNSDEDTILNYILMPINSDTLVSYIQQTAARFLNALASLNSGRKYLTVGPIALNSIIKYLDSCNNGTGDGVTLDMLIATLQKMSLRKEQRQFMVEANLVEWLIYHLSNENFRMGTYRLEYTCALMMNLSLQSAARLRAAVIAPFFVSILTSLLSSDCVSILPYVNGALQNFLLNNEVNEEAKKLHLAEILEYYCVKSGEELRNHFSHTLKVHKREYDANLSDDEFPDEDDDIFDVLEKELEEDDPIKFEKEELQGDSLLFSHYSFCTLDSEKVTTSREYKVTSTQTDTSSQKESKSVTLNASTVINVAGETCTSEVADDHHTETADTKSSTDAVAKAHRKVTITFKNGTKSGENEDETIFQAKPKIQRTPPLTARIQPNQEKIPRRFPSKIK